MSIFKKTVTILVTYAVALTLVLGVMLADAKTEAAYYKREAASNYSHAFGEVAAAMEEMSAALKKAMYASSPSMISAICTEAYAQSQMARQALGVLPYGNRKLENTASFISKAGDYLRSLSKSSAAGKAITDEQRETLHSMSESAEDLSMRLMELEAGVIGGGYDLMVLTESEDVLGKSEDSLIDTGLIDGFKEMDTEISQLPTLIYDGPFSQHISDMAPRLTEGKQELSEEDAIYMAAEFTGLDRTSLDLVGVRETPVPVYLITADTKAGNVYMELTRQGGFVTFYTHDRQVYTSEFGAEECVQAAKAFLSRRGLESMVTTYWTVQDNGVLVNFAYEQDGVICYPDLIKVTVSQDNREIIGFESLGYVMSHSKRELTKPDVSEEDIMRSMSPELTVESSRLAVIPTEGKNEVLCYEYRCTDSQGRHTLVYVNVETGIEEQILVLLEDETGTLTM